jgi:hypothetical protein
MRSLSTWPDKDIPMLIRCSGNVPARSNVVIVFQPETYLITQDQLVNKVKGIYAGMVMAEKNCIKT